jgi:ribonuclease P protein component
VLPRHARLTSPNDFARATKSGHRLTSKSLVLYFYSGADVTPARFGLIIGKSVGGSVVRHHIARKIRHTLRDHMTQFPAGSLVVVRALPHSTKADIKVELDKAIPKLLEKSVVSK